MLLKNASSYQTLLNAPAKKIILSGPSGFLGGRVLDSILNVHALRKSQGIPPGEVVLMSGSPGKLMQKLYGKYGADAMKTVKASRVDYYTQHDVDTWTDHLGSLGAEGSHSVFVNLAAVAGPMPNKPDAMMDVNYKAPAAAARACEKLGFGHWIQSSTQATNAERGGQVPYSRGKAMADFALARSKDMPVSIACLGLLYSKADGLIGQERKGESKINLIDLALLPLTPIMGDGSAPLQPQEVTDASDRLAFLALIDPLMRPKQYSDTTRGARGRQQLLKYARSDTFRYYDAVGPHTMSILEMLNKFAISQGNTHFRPVFIGYRNMERLLNIKSLGNLNRQFVSLLRSEQDASNPVIGDPMVWEKVLGADARLLPLDEAFKQNEEVLRNRHFRRFPYINTLKFALRNPKIIMPGIELGLEITRSFVRSFGPGKTLDRLDKVEVEQPARPKEAQAQAQAQGLDIAMPKEAQAQTKTSSQSQIV